MRFLSTLSLRRATRQIDAVRFAGLYFYPRSPCGERPADRCGAFCRSLFLSTLSLRRATQAAAIYRRSGIFLSTLSLRRATLPPGPGLGMPAHFYPRSPCGERQPAAWRRSPSMRHFYPRSPCGERQANAVDQILPGHISIHALLAESDYGRCVLRIVSVCNISIHALLAESDMMV